MSFCRTIVCNARNLYFRCWSALKTFARWALSSRRLQLSSRWWLSWWKWKVCSMISIKRRISLLLQISMIRCYFLLLCLYRCVACKCQECAQSPKGSEIFNPPLTFVIDTTKSVKPDKDSIFNLTQKGTFFYKQIRIEEYWKYWNRTYINTQ